MDIRASEAARLYQSARPATEPGPERPGLGGTLANAAESFVRTLATAETAAEETMLGRGDPHALVEALAQSEIAVETAVTLRNKVVEAYQEILRMPV